MASSPGGSTSHTPGSSTGHKPGGSTSHTPGSSTGHKPGGSTMSGTEGSTPARKQLPSIPSEDSIQNAFSPRSTPDAALLKARGTIFLEYSLMAEYKQLEKQKLPGVFVIPSAKSPLCWNGVLFIRQGFYQGGVFKFHLHIPENYPDGDCPRVVFELPIFHPLIDPASGELDVKRGFQKWRRQVNHLWQVLLYARRVFYKIDTKTPHNPEAAVLYEQELELYKGKVAETIRMCQDRLYDPPSSDDPHSIRFSRWDADLHEGVHEDMLNHKKVSNDGQKNAHTSGLSWMSHDATDILMSSSPSSPVCHLFPP